MPVGYANPSPTATVRAKENGGQIWPPLIARFRCVLDAASLFGAGEIVSALINVDLIGDAVVDDD